MKGDSASQVDRYSRKDASPSFGELSQRPEGEAISAGSPEITDWIDSASVARLMVGQERVCCHYRVVKARGLEPSGEAFGPAA